MTTVNQICYKPTTSKGLDDTLYCRQLYVLGEDAMYRMAKSDVLVSGMRGVGAEIAKNVILAGVKSVTLHDQGQCQLADLSSNFYLTPKDIGLNRAEACTKKFSELNSYVDTRSYSGDLSEDFLGLFDVVVLTESSLEEQLDVSELARSAGFALIIACTSGLFGQIFCDFGEKFVVEDVTGESPHSALIANITRKPQGVVTCVPEARHNFEDGDIVKFADVEGMTELNDESFTAKITVIDTHSFNIGNTMKFKKYIRGGVVTQVKRPVEVSFKTLGQSLNDPTFVVCDDIKYCRIPQLHLAFQTLHSYKTTYGCYPRPWDVDNAKSFLSIAKTVKESCSLKFKIDNEILEIFSKTCAGDVSPVNSFIGGVAAQEVLKACSGKFFPIHQWLYFDALECLPVMPNSVDKNDCDSEENRYAGQIAIFGKDFQDKLANLKYFMIGAGAIGCELLKNFALMGIGTKEDGLIIITDMDYVEKSNLNRQFLFRPGDVNKSKATVAAEAIRQMNGNINVIAHSNRIGHCTEHIYGDDFFKQLDGVLTGLDNVEARHFVDRQCIYYQKPLIDSGTLGTKGNTQVIVPFLTESYTSSHDPPDPAIPVCTLKNFPNSIEHTLQWARDIFEEQFCKSVESAAEYLTDKGFLQRTMKRQGSQQYEILESVHKALTSNRPTSFQDCVAWARIYWEEQYHNRIQQILFNFPPDLKTEEGAPFWSGSKKCPHPLTFSEKIPLHLDFIVAAANLKASVYGIPQNRNPAEVAEMVKNVVVSKFTPKKNVVIQITDVESQTNVASLSTDDRTLEELISQLPDREKLSDLHLTPLCFEKDDDSNLHMDFIISASNLRALNYRIPQADRRQSKLIAGKIIPAIATTTAVVAGLACLELYKLVQGHSNIELFKNAYFNLALPLFTFSEPVAAPKMTYRDHEWTLWDRFELQGELTLQEFLDYFRTTYGLEVTMLSHDFSMLYSFFMPENKRQKRLSLPMSDIVREVSRKDIGSTVKALVFEVSCNDVSGNDVDVPYVRYVLPLIHPDCE